MGTKGTISSLLRMLVVILAEMVFSIDGWPIRVVISRAWAQHSWAALVLQQLCNHTATSCLPKGEVTWWLSGGKGGSAVCWCNSSYGNSIPAFLPCIVVKQEWLGGGVLGAMRRGRRTEAMSLAGSVKGQSEGETCNPTKLPWDPSWEGTNPKGLSGVASEWWSPPEWRDQCPWWKGIL